MKCSNCGTEFEGKFCHHCGTPAPSSKPDSTPTPDDCFTDYGNEYANQGSPDVDENRHVSDWNTPDNTHSPEPQKKGKGCVIAVIVTVVVLIIAFIILLVPIVNGLVDSYSYASIKEVPAIQVIADRFFMLSII